MAPVYGGSGVGEQRELVAAVPRGVQLARHRRRPRASPAAAGGPASIAPSRSTSGSATPPAASGPASTAGMRSCRRAASRSAGTVTIVHDATRPVGVLRPRDAPQPRERERLAAAQPVQERLARLLGVLGSLPLEPAVGGDQAAVRAVVGERAPRAAGAQLVVARVDQRPHALERRPRRREPPAQHHRPARRRRRRPTTASTVLGRADVRPPERLGRQGRVGDAEPVATSAGVVVESV